MKITIYFRTVIPDIDNMIYKSGIKYKNLILKKFDRNLNPCFYGSLKFRQTR